MRNVVSCGMDTGRLLVGAMPDVNVVCDPARRMLVGFVPDEWI